MTKNNVELTTTSKSRRKEVSTAPSDRSFSTRARRFVSFQFKCRAPKLWRLFFGFPVPQSDRYEDYCETRRPAELAKDVLGRRGEEFVFERVRQDSHCRVIACNAENYYCEIDIVFLDEKTREIVFLEVKTRRREDPRFPSTLHAVDAKRRKKLALAAREFILERGYLDYRMRFDVAVVIMPEEGEPELRYYKSAFHYANAERDYRGNDFGKTRSSKNLREDVRKRSECEK